jgi:hypothetical protein
VTYYNRNFTIEPSKKLFVQIQPTNNTEFGQYDGTITFKYYVYDPKCADFTYWNGTDCEPDFLSYCESLTPDYILATGDPTTTVIYNGTACVVANQTKMQEDFINGFIAERLIDQLSRFQGDPLYVPLDMRQRDTLFYQDFLARKKQNSSLFACVAILAGCFIYWTIWGIKDMCDKCKKERKERLRILEEAAEQAAIAEEAALMDDFSKKVDQKKLNKADDVIYDDQKPSDGAIDLAGLRT